jgi:YD repeat-containing protein
MTQMTSTVDGTTSYTGYDAENELTHTTQSANSTLLPEDFKYDANGNRTSGGRVTGADNRLLFDGE